MSKMSRTKGHSFERLTAINFREIFGGARRHLEYHGEDANGVDIDGTDPFKIQCKRERKYSNLRAIEQVKCDRILGDIPVLITKGDNKETIAAIYLEDFLDLIRELNNLRSRG